MVGPLATAGPEVGQTGARFGSPAMRRRRQAEALEHQTSPDPPPTARDTAPAADAGPLLPDGPSAPGGAAAPGTVPGGAVRGWFDDPPAPEPTHSLVRPYAWTGGRTTSRYDLRVETLVSLAGHGRVAEALRGSDPEYRFIAELCARPRSVAEVSAALAVPLGVVRVLLSDLIGMDVLVLHETRSGPGGTVDKELLGRVLAGLQRL